MKPQIDLSLYHVTDGPLSAGRGLVETVLAAARGGATLIQLRDPQAKASALIAQGQALISALEPFDIPLIINDRPDVALAIGAAGVHLGQGDLPPRVARAILGPDAIIGLSITDPAELAGVEWDVIDHLGVGPVFGKGVKADANEPIGIAGLSATIRLATKPVVGIGGIGPGNARSCILAGAAGVAVVGAIAAAHEPEAATRTLRAVIENARAEQKGQAS